MDHDFFKFYARNIPLRSIGKDNLLKLNNRKVLIAGMGGLGTISSDLLVSLGVNNIRIIDFDIVDFSNIARQRLYTPEDVGKPKVEVAEQYLKKRYPYLNIESFALQIDSDNASDIIKGVDLIVDALDNFTTREALFRAAYKMKVPYVFAGAVADNANIMTFNHDNDTPCLGCLLGKFEDDENRTCAVLGVNPIILQLAVAFQVSEALKLLVDDKPILVGKLRIIDLEDISVQDISINKNENCPICGNNIEIKSVKYNHYMVGDFGEVRVSSLCGRDAYMISPKWKISWDFDKVKNIIERTWGKVSVGIKHITFNIDGYNVTLLNTGIFSGRSIGNAENAVRVYGKILSKIFK